MKKISALLSIFTLVMMNFCSSTREEVVEVGDEAISQSMETVQVPSAQMPTTQIPTTSEVASNVSSSVTSRLPNNQWVLPGSGSFPQTANPGECFAKIHVPAKVEKKTERVLVKPASKIIKSVPAEFGYANKTITVNGPSSRLETVPATYKNVTERVISVEASERIVTVPATYETVTERILVRPAQKAWKKGDEWRNKGSVASKTTAEGDVMCLVEIPAEYKTVSKRVMKTPPSSRTVVIPAQYKTVSKRVVDRPASVREIPIPATTKTVKVREVTKPASTREIVVPAQYRTITKEVVVNEGSDEWHRVLCKTNQKSDIVTRLQRKLKSLGFYNGGVDGILGPGTHNAVARYQSSRMGASHYRGRITYTTLSHMGLISSGTASL